MEIFLLVSVTLNTFLLFELLTLQRFKKQSNDLFWRLAASADESSRLNHLLLRRLNDAHRRNDPEAERQSP